MLTIVVGSTLKGLATGLIAGFVARWRRSTGLGIGAGLLAGFILSSLAAIGQNGRYLEIVLPGMLVGALTGFVTHRYPQFPASNREAHVWLFVLLAATPRAHHVNLKILAVERRESGGCEPPDL